MRTLRWGIIGCGLVAEDLVQSFSQCRHSHQVICAASSDINKAYTFLDGCQIKSGRAYSDYAELLQNPDVDVVFIDLTNDAHITWALKGIEAGKHVLCEKPLAINAKQVRLIVDKARLSGRFLMEAFWSRFFTAWQKIKQIIDSRELGQLQVFHCNLGSGRLTNPRDLAKGECSLMSLGIYPICLALFVFGDVKPQRIDVVGGMDTTTDTDSWANITLHFSNNQHAFLYYNSECFSPTSAFFSFEFGQVQISQYFWSLEKFTLISGPLKGGKVQEFEYPLNDSFTYNFKNGSGLRYQSDHVFESIRDGHTSSDIMSLEASLLLAETMDEIRHRLNVCFPQD